MSGLTYIGPLFMSTTNAWHGNRLIGESVGVKVYRDERDNIVLKLEDACRVIWGVRITHTFTREEFERFTDRDPRIVRAAAYDLFSVTTMWNNTDDNYFYCRHQRWTPARDCGTSSTQSNCGRHRRFFQGDRRRARGFYCSGSSSVAGLLVSN
jgi:hypothetical protein